MKFNKKTPWQLLFVVALLFNSTTSFSQEKVWEVDLKESLYKVGWILQSNDGMVIAAGAKGLIALDNNTGETVWHNTELMGIDKNTYLNIEGLPLFYVEYAPIVGVNRGVIINSSTGDIVFDTKEDGYQIKYYEMHPDKGCILFEMLKGSERNLMKFSLKTWESDWVVSLGTPKGLLSKANDKFSASSFIDHGPMFSKDGHLVVGIHSQIYGINFENGEIAWDNVTNKKIKALVYSDLNNSLYVGIRKSKKLTVLDPESGKDITPGKLKLRGTMLDIRPDGNGKLVLVETAGFNLIDPKTNDFVWKKSYKIAYLDEVIPYKDKYVAIGKNDKDGSISLVNNSGKKIWDSKIKGYSYYVTPTKKGVLYISTKRSNILDYVKGKDVWDKDVKFKSIPAVTFDEKEDKVVLFENKKGYKFSLKTGKVDLFAEDIEMENVNKKTPLVAETIENGYFVSTGQHASVLTRKGKLSYTNFYPPVTSIGGIKQAAQVGLLVAGVDFDIQGAMNNIDKLSAITNHSFDQTDASINEKKFVDFYAGPTGKPTPRMSIAFQLTLKRHSNSKNSKDHKFVVTKQENGQNYIFMINKNTGKIDKKIQLMDKTPNYFIDEIDNRVFINEKNYLISSYQM